MVQYDALKKIDGLQDVKIFRPGYAIEYDYYQPTQLNHTLETKKLKNLGSVSSKGKEGWKNSEARY